MLTVFNGVTIYIWRNYAVQGQQPSTIDIYWFINIDVNAQHLPVLRHSTESRYIGTPCFVGADV